MFDNINNAASLGINISSGESSEIGSSAYDFTTGLLDSTPLGKIMDYQLNLVDIGLSHVEKTKIIAGAKRNFHIHISHKLAVKISSLTTPSISSAESISLQQSKNAQEWMSNTAELYKKHQSGYQYKIQRKIQDKSRDIKKKPMALIKIPLSLLPLGEVADIGIKASEYAIDKYLEKRRENRKNEYLSENNRLQLLSRLGESEYNRKQAKWKSKDIAGLGPDIQRNLYKLKQAVEILNSKSIQMTSYSLSATKTNGFRQTRESMAMSIYEVTHYIEKLSEMCSVMEATAVTINAYLSCLKQLTESHKDLIIKSF